jgi:PhnB protein
VFAAEELVRMSSPDGKISHAEMKIGDLIIFLNGEMGPSAAVAPGAPRIYLFLYVENADKTFRRAVAAGAQIDMALEDQFWGDRYGKVTDPFGHQWGIATHVEDVARQDIGKRAAAFFAKAAGHS